MTQVLPANESFESPDWLISTSGAATKSMYWYNYWPGFSPGTQINASTYSTYPQRTGGVMGGSGTSALLRPEPDSLTALPCLMTDTNGMDTSDRIRSVLCREEAAFNHDDQDITVMFGLEKVGGGVQGFSMAGTKGSSPSKGGSFKYPDASSASGPVFTTMASASAAPGNWTSGGAVMVRGSDESPMNPWPAWEGSAIYFRAGTGEPTPINGAQQDAATGYSKRLWYYSCVTHYSFVAYPSGGIVTAPDLVLELWQVKYTNSGATAGNVPRLVCRQTVTSGVDKIDFRQGYHLRVKVKNDSPVTLNPVMECFIGTYRDANDEPLAEVQCFKTDAIPSGNTFVSGTDVVHDQAAGTVTDRHADKLPVYADRTIGFAAAQEGLLEVSAKIGEPQAVYWFVHTGMYSVESKSIPASGSATVRFRDEFSRVIEGATNTGRSGVLTPITSQTSVSGVQVNGMFTFDGYARQYPTTLSTTEPNLDMIRRQLLWTASTSSTTPVDYCLLDYDWDDSAVNRPYLVSRSFIHQRPSTQLYNHHRSIEFKPGAEYGLLGVTAIEYELGIHLRGSFNGATTSGLCAYIGWKTDGDSAITYATVSVVERNHLYDQQNPASTEANNFQRLIARRVYLTGTSAGFPNLYDGNWHTLDFEIKNYASSPSSEGIALYNIKLDTAPLELTDTDAPYQSSTVSPYTVVEANNSHPAGSSEGFWFLGSITEVQSAGRAWSPAIVRNWTEQALTSDPSGEDGPDQMASIPLDGEGTPTGSLNTDTGALSISGSGVWDVETVVTVENFFASHYIPFDSGHKYTSPLYSRNRRRWQVVVNSMDETLYQSLLSFYNSHDGSEVPFTFIVPVTNDGTEILSVAGSRESVIAWFGEDSLDVTELPGKVYNAAFSIEELLVS